VGDVARQTGQAAASTASAAKKFNDEHNITGKLYDATSAAANKAKEVNSKYNITGKLTAGATSAYQRASEFDKKNNVTGKVGSSISSGLTAFTSAMGGAPGKKKDLPSVPQ
jgi:hypothetical protein